ncbi:MAG: hypothetical protein HY860_06070 [Chlamydiales bacterium]|nr:hypothetical protein [Chlamydiales bacterium]
MDPSSSVDPSMVGRGFSTSTSSSGRPRSSSMMSGRTISSTSSSSPSVRTTAAGTTQAVLQPLSIIATVFRTVHLGRGIDNVYRKEQKLEAVQQTKINKLFGEVIGKVAAGQTRDKITDRIPGSLVFSATTGWGSYKTESDDSEMEHKFYVQTQDRTKLLEALGGRHYCRFDYDCTGDINSKVRSFDRSASPVLAGLPTDFASVAGTYLDAPLSSLPVQNKKDAFTRIAYAQRSKHKALYFVEQKIGEQKEHIARLVQGGPQQDLQAAREKLGQYEKLLQMLQRTDEFALTTGLAYFDRSNTSDSEEAFEKMQKDLNEKLGAESHIWHITGAGRDKASDEKVQGIQQFLSDIGGVGQTLDTIMPYVEKHSETGLPSAPNAVNEFARIAYYAAEEVGSDEMDEEAFMAMLVPVVGEPFATEFVQYINLNKDEKKEITDALQGVPQEAWKDSNAFKGSSVLSHPPVLRALIEVSKRPTSMPTIPVTSSVIVTDSSSSGSPVSPSSLGSGRADSTSRASSGVDDEGDD